MIKAKSEGYPKNNESPVKASALSSPVKIRLSENLSTGGLNPDSSSK
jgi:hypothetical protein